MRNITTFEVRVNVKKDGARRYQSFLAMHIQDEVTKVFHIDARTPEQAKKKAKKHGHPISVRKADVFKMVGNIEKIRLDLVNPYPDAVAMDEMIWKKKKRIKNREKDKNTLDKPHND